MLTPVRSPDLAAGERLTVTEFLSRWEDLPNLKHAELIDGVVYLSSPVSLEHARRAHRVDMWLGYYADMTPGCECAIDGTWLMSGSAPQPDVYLRILPAHGGQSAEGGKYGAGAPELIAEISASSADVDRGPKLALYQKAGVREYIIVELMEQRIVWRWLEAGAYVGQEPRPDSILRSRIFPGRWLDVAAFWADDAGKVLATLQAGLATAKGQPSA